MKIKEQLKSYREIAEDCFDEDDLVNDKLAFSLLSSTKEWVNIRDVLFILEQKRKEYEKKKPMYYLVKKQTIDEILGDFALNDCTK